MGLEWFERFFTAPTCGRMIKNTILLSLYSLLWGFPVPISFETIDGTALLDVEKYDLKFGNKED